jgi:GNAT superfamily N-acetyltransferase
MTLRPTTATDAPAIAGILTGWVAETPWMPGLHTPEQDLWFAGHLIGTQDVTVLALPGGVGVMSLEGNATTALHLSPGVRGQGHGQRLLATAQQGSNRLTLWTFQANVGARRFYDLAGFAEIARTDGAGNEEGLADMQLQWGRTP